MRITTATKSLYPKWQVTGSAAINRGEKEKFLTVKVGAPEERILRYLEKW